MARGDEKLWVQSMQPGLESALQAFGPDAIAVKTTTGFRLAYAYEVLQYTAENKPITHSAGYETDLLVYDELGNGDWIPRVVIEFKLGSVTTHDALTYSSKAATHKHVHPYLRYGILIGDWGGTPLPPRLVRHGAYFDFMAVLEGRELSVPETARIAAILRQEIDASRKLQGLLSDRSASKKTFRVLHRPLVLE